MMNRYHLKQSGLTIVELMVGLMLSLLLVAGVLQVYLGSQTTYKVTEGLSRMQESTRSAAELIAKEIRMAGYIPCSQPEDAVSLIDPNEQDWWTALFDQPIRGYDDTDSRSNFPSDIATDVKQGTDAIVILRAGKNVAGVEVFDDANKKFILQRAIDGNSFAQSGSLMVACDSTNARLFQASTVGDNSITVAEAGGSLKPGNTSEINYLFGSDSQISNYSAVAYYIRQSSSGNANEYSLYRKYLLVNGDGDSEVSNAEELAEGIENMQLLYGYDDNGDGFADRYLNAKHGEFTNDSNNWQNVASVKIGLLYASEDGLREANDLDNGEYIVANTLIGTSEGSATVTHEKDRRKRYVATTTVMLRNL